MQIVCTAPTRQHELRPLLSEIYNLSALEGLDRETGGGDLSEVRVVAKRCEAFYYTAVEMAVGRCTMGTVVVRL